MLASAGPGPQQQGHLLHVLLLGAWLPIFFVALACERAKRHRRPRARTGHRLRANGWCTPLAIASVNAALPHAAVTADHYRESIWYGCFFLTAAAGQLAFAGAVLIRPSRAIVRLAITGSVLIIGLWLFTRTVSVPIGPGRGETESVGLPDAIATLAEAGTAILGSLALRAWSRRPDPLPLLRQVLVR
jgi:hypothetical protein